MNRVRITTALLIVAFASAVASAQEKPKNPKPDQKIEAPTIAGKWRMPLETPHGSMAAVFELKIDAKDKRKITGTFSMEHMGVLPLAGEYVEGKLQFKAKSETMEMSFAGKLKDADTLTGILSSPNGDLAVTATRVKEK
jgi:hypothetical protein